MTGWADTRRRRRWSALSPGLQTGAVFAVVALLLLLIPNGLVEGAAGAASLSGFWPGATPPFGLAGRLFLGIGGGLLAALAYAGAQWLLEHRRPVRSATIQVVGDDPLVVQPLAADRDLGARFDDSPYLKPADTAPAPPTPDARIDPDSTMGDPRWTVPSAGREAPVEAPAPLIERQGGWDRQAPDRLEDGVVDDGPDAEDGEHRRLNGVPDAGPSVVRVSPAIEEFLHAELSRLERELNGPDEADDLPPTDELLIRLAAASDARQRAVPPPPSALSAPSGSAVADELSRSMAILKRGAA